MSTFIFILAGLIAFNFILLKFSMQSVDTNKKKVSTRKSKINKINGKTNNKSKTEEIPNAA